MTKRENEKCKQLMYEAIRKANDSKEDYSAYERLMKEGKQIDGRCKLRVADQEIGYAEGIHQALSVIGYKHEDMKQLLKLL